MNKCCEVYYHYMDGDEHIEDEKDYPKATSIEVWVQEHFGIDPTVGEPFDIPDQYIKTFPPTQEGLEQARDYADELCIKHDTDEIPWDVNGFY
jgi:hypothetical protein